MTSISPALCRTYGNNFKRHYLKNKKIFLDFSLPFWNVHEIYSIVKKKMSILASLFTIFLTLKDLST